MSAPLAHLSINEIAAQDRQLVDLCVVHDIRLARCQRALDDALREGEELDELLDMLRSDLARVDEQRRYWVQRWQDWLESGGTVQHGRGFTQRHAEFGELEGVLLQHQREIGGQRQQAQSRIDAARAERQRHMRLRDALRDKRRALLRAGESRRESQLDELATEHALARWHNQRSSDGAIAEGVL
ncbi:MAG TPA: hypothetical protein VLC92_06495 [Rhodocyclaceae bacterium]|nr:hypothetical protein [Rhodocyclaceae bacterium]